MSNTSRESVWLLNPHGVKVALPPHLAAERLKQAGWMRTEPDFVHAEKQYPIDGELTEEGEKRRMHRRERAANPILPRGLHADPVQAQALTQAHNGQLLAPAEYHSMDWKALRQYANLRGINTMQAGMTKEKVIALLDARAV